MLIGNFILLFCVIESSRVKARVWLGIMLACICICIVAIYIIDGAYWIFFIAYAGVVFYELILTISLVYEYSTIVSRLLIILIIIYMIGIMLWCLDNLYCNYVHALQFHAVWHLCAGYGIINCLFISFSCNYVEYQKVLTFYMSKF